MRKEDTPEAGDIVEDWLKKRGAGPERRAALLPAAWRAFAAKARADFERFQAHLLREIAGNPFRPVTFEPGLRRWNDGALVQLATAIEAEERWQDLPVLADALEEAGCAEEALAAHCRRAGGHVRGCWALAAIVGR
jgi:hypothetical protein